MKLNKSLFFTAAAALLLAVLPLVASVVAYAADFTEPGVIPPSGCRQAALLSTDQFISTGFSNVRTGEPNANIVAGAWVIVTNLIKDTSVVPPPHCTLGNIAAITSFYGTNVMGIQLKPTIGSAQDADIQQINLYQDVNLDGQYEPLIDLQIGTKPGSDLDTADGAVFFNGPQAPLLVAGGGIPAAACKLGPPIPPIPLGGSLSHTVVSGGTPVIPAASGLPARSAVAILAPCAVGVLAVAKIGPNPHTGTQFGLQMEALAGDVPGAGSAVNPTGPLMADVVSNGFSSSNNPLGSNVRLLMVGGNPTGQTPITNISNSSGNVETDVATLTLSGLKTRFKDPDIVPGTREAIAIAVTVCDGSTEANHVATILPSIAGAPPTIAGGLASLPCIPSAGVDLFNTGINGATVIFRGPLAKYMQTVRMYEDLGGPGAAFPGVAGGPGNGILFQAGEMVQAATPVYNAATGEAIVSFGRRQGQVLFNGVGTPVAALKAGSYFLAAPAPRVLIFTVDIDSNSPGGQVDVFLGLQSFDDTSQVAGIAPCTAAGFIQALPSFCASNFQNIGPETFSFTVTGPAATCPAGTTGTPPNCTPITQPVPCKTIEQAIDVDGNKVIEDNEIITAVGFWTNGTAVPNACAPGTINDAEILKLASLWVTGNVITSTSASGLEKSTGPSLWDQILNFFSSGKSATLSGTQAATAAQVTPGGSFEVTVNVKADRAQSGLLLSEQLPAGWTATPVASGSAYAKVNEPKWLWLGVRGQTTVTYQVNVPADAQAGSYQIGGALESAGADRATLTPLTIAVAGGPQALSVESVKAQALDGGSTQFVVAGSGVAGLQVQVYDLSGKIVFDQTTNGTTLTFRGLGVDGQPLANGVYLYAVTIKGVTGQSVTTQVKKLVVLR